MFRIFSFIVASLLLSVSACSDNSSTAVHEEGKGSEPFAWNIPSHIPLPLLNAANPMTEEKFQLGRRLFYDARLSGNGLISCSSCHQQDKAFSDGRPVAIGSTGESHPRNSQALVNAAYNASLTWANSSLLTIEQQIFTPLFGEHPIEHGITDQNWPEIEGCIKAEALYPLLFARAYPDSQELYTKAQIINALAVFVKGLTSFNSAYDRHLAGDNADYSDSAQRGQNLFFGEKMECFHCHGGYNFTDSTVDRTMSFVNRPFHNTGLYNLDGQGRYPDDNRGVYELSGKATDMGRFRAPSLRNVAKSAPYMHDGSIKSLNEVLDFYAAGGRNIVSGERQGDGRKNPFKDGFVTGFVITEQDKRDVITFLESLTDESFLTNPRFSNPWQ